MGVSIRAGYRFAKLINDSIIKGHPIIGSCEYYITKIEELMDKWNYDIFFLACEDREYVSKIESYFGNRCCHMDRKYIHFFENDNPVESLEDRMVEFQNSTVKERNIEYIVETYLLSMCESAFLTLGSGSQFAYILNGGKYINTEIHQEGMY